MRNLQQVRQEINRIDAAMAQLFEERMQMSLEIAQYKAAHLLPVRDIAREEALLAQNMERLPSALHPYYEAFLREIMHQSCLYQENWIENQTKEENV